MRSNFVADLAALLASSATQVEVSSVRNGSAAAAGTAVVVSFRVRGGGGAAPPTTRLQSLFANGARTLAGGVSVPSSLALTSPGNSECARWHLFSTAPFGLESTYYIAPVPFINNNK